MIGPPLSAAPCAESKDTGALHGWFGCCPCGGSGRPEESVCRARIGKNGKNGNIRLRQKVSRSTA